MDFASSLISVEKKRAGPGLAENPGNPDRCAIKHEVVALILTAIRTSVLKRRTRTIPASPLHNPCIFNVVQRIVRFSTAGRGVPVRNFSSMAAPSGGLARIVKLAALSVLLILPALAQAQESSDRPALQNQQQATTKKTEKQPPPPLFSRHRRGIYKNALGVAVVDATPQSPPLETDDPSVPDQVATP
jgi:hypothetical protein